jgi:nicotinamidase-related amidase
MPDRPTLDPDHTALLVMDYQTGIVSRLPNNDQLLDLVAATIDNVRGRGAQIGWVRVALDDADFDLVPETSIFSAMATGEQRHAMHADADSTQIHPELQPESGDVMVRKTRVGAFQTTDLDQQLRSRGIHTLVLAGLSTSGVVLSTVREAMDRDYRIVVLEDACADGDADTHSFLTGKLFPKHTYVTTVAELDTLWVKRA